MVKTMIPLRVKHIALELVYLRFELLQADKICLLSGQPVKETFFSRSTNTVEICRYDSHGENFKFEKKQFTTETQRTQSFH